MMMFIGGVVAVFVGTLLTAFWPIIFRIGAVVAILVLVFGGIYAIGAATVGPGYAVTLVCMTVFVAAVEMA